MTGKHSRGHTHGRSLRYVGAITLAAAALLVAAAVASAAPALSWAGAQSAGGSSLTGVACPSFGLCVAVAGTEAEVKTSPTSGSSWSADPTSASGSLLAVSCAPGSSFCAAVGDGGAITVTSNASSWTPKSASGESANLTSVSCPSSSFCLAVDASGNAVYSSDSGASWQLVSGIDSSNHLTGVACATSAFCVAVDQSGRILASANPTGSSWTVEAHDGSALTGVSCSSGGTCVAVDASGYAWASADASSATPTWSATPIAGALSAVACTAEAMCVASDGGTAYASDDPASGAPTWVASAADANTINALSCTDQGLCAAVDAVGDGVVATLAAPSVTTGSATATSQTTTTLTATVNPGDAVITSCYFNYGTSTSYGAAVPCSAAPSPTGGPQTVSAQLGGLTASTGYDFQIVAVSNDGAGIGTNATFTTAAPLKASPSISGTPAVGDKLSCNLGLTLPAGLTVTYKWGRDTTTIAGATAATYVVALADETHHLYCNATISGDGGSAGANSGYVAVPAETLGEVSETTVGRPVASGARVSMTVTCSPQAVSSCTVSLRLTTLGKHSITIGSSSTRLTPGAAAKVSVSLNAAGRRLLAAHRHLKATLTVSGTVVGVIRATIKRQSVKFAPLRGSRRNGG